MDRRRRTTRTSASGTRRPASTCSRLSGHNGPVTGLDWSPDSTRLASGGNDGTTRIWEISATGVHELASLSSRGTRSGVQSVSFSPDGQRILAGDTGVNAVTVWDISASGGGEWASVAARPAFDRPSRSPRTGPVS